MKRITATALLALTLLAAAQPGKDALNSVTYDELSQRVFSLRGKVVVVYFWSFTCGPCKSKGVPRLKAMQEKYAKDGLVVLGVLLDDRKDTALLASGVKYLDKIKPPFEMIRLDFPSVEFWQKRLRFNGYPGVFVFNRDIEHVLKLPVLDETGREIAEVDYDLVERAVVNLIETRTP